MTAIWSDEDVIRLLDSIKRHKLFDVTSKGMVSWSEVQKEMFPYDLKKMKNKFYHLTQHFRLLLKKKRAAESKGLEYHPPTIWFQHMIDIYGDSIKSPQKRRLKEEEVAVDSTPVHFLEDYPSVTHTGGSRLIVEDIEGDMLKKILVSKPTGPRSANVSRRIYSDQVNGNDSNEEADDSLIEACDAFGKSVALQLKQLPFIKSMELQMKIQALITEELVKIRKKNSLST